MPLGSSEPLWVTRGHGEACLKAELLALPCRRPGGHLPCRCQLQPRRCFRKGWSDAPPDLWHKHPRQKRMLTAQLRGPARNRPSCPPRLDGVWQQRETEAGQMGMTWRQELGISEGWGPWDPGTMGVPAPTRPCLQCQREGELSPGGMAWMAGLPGFPALDPRALWAETPVAETLF